MALSPKCYYTYDMDKKDSKLGAKGCSRLQDLTLEIFLDKLYGHENHKFQMNQLRVVDGTMSRVSSEKSSISDLFSKFRVSADMISCSPLTENGEIL